MRDEAEVTAAGWVEDDDAGQRCYGSVLDFVPPAMGRRASTFRGGAIHAIRPAGSLSLVAESHYATVFLTAVPGARASLDGGGVREFDVPAGALGIVPAGCAGATTWSLNRESVAVVITPSSLCQLAEREFDCDGFDLRPLMAITADPWASHLAGLLKAELADKPEVNELYVDSLITLFGVHILRGYSGSDRQLPQVRGGLSLQNERRIKEYVEANFAAKLSVAELAAVCQLSPSHFIQAFSRTFGQRPHQYLTNLRLDHAGRLLGSSGMTIAEIAYRSGFSSQSHLTSTLRKYRGLTPAQLRPGSRHHPIAAR